jgi:methionyl-tRNA synthetase
VPEQGQLSDEDKAQLNMVCGLPEKAAAQIEGFHFKLALQEIMAAARDSNRYLDHRAPWRLRKTDMAACATAINVMLNTIKTLCVVAEPFVPFGAQKIARMLACEQAELKWAAAARPLPVGRALGEAQIPFVKLEPSAGPKPADQ